MTCDFTSLLNCISVTSGRCFGDNDRLCAMEIKLVKILQELTESEPKAYPKHQRERWTNTSPQTIKLQVTSRVSSSFPNSGNSATLLNQTNRTHRSVQIKTFKNWTGTVYGSEDFTSSEDRTRLDQ